MAEYSTLGLSFFSSFLFFFFSYLSFFSWKPGVWNWMA